LGRTAVQGLGPGGGPGTGVTVFSGAFHSGPPRGIPAAPSLPCGGVRPISWNHCLRAQGGIRVCRCSGFPGPPTGPPTLRPALFSHANGVATENTRWRGFCDLQPGCGCPIGSRIMGRTGSSSDQGRFLNNWRSPCQGILGRGNQIPPFGRNTSAPALSSCGWNLGWRFREGDGRQRVPDDRAAPVLGFVWRLSGTVPHPRYLGVVSKVVRGESSGCEQFPCLRIFLSLPLFEWVWSAIEIRGRDFVAL